jgi:type VI secretion system protein ImpK
MSGKTSLDDPFAEIGSGRTFVMPTPGARPAPSRSAPDLPEPAADIEAVDSGLSPLLALANRLLAVVPQIRLTQQLGDAAGLRESIAAEIRAFEARARAKAIAPERVLAARYILCTLIDEAAAGMPWGSGGQWGRHSLLAMFHNETGGGEKVFQLMAKLAQDPAANRDLLELIYAALCFGFEGRYRIADGGRAQLESVRERLAQILRKERGDYPAALSQHWQGVLPNRRPMLTWLPLAATGAVFALLLAGIYLFFALRLADQSDPLYARILSLRPGGAPLPAPVARAPSAQPRLAGFLQSEIQAGLVTVRDEQDRSVVVLRGDGLFAPASASVDVQRIALLQRIAAALARVPGRVVVSGHTDNVPIRTARFPSNWHLSQERAIAVRDLVAHSGVAAERVHAEGRADGEPLAPNDTPASRALNRRVEITLETPAGRGDSS